MYHTTEYKPVAQDEPQLLNHIPSVPYHSDATVAISKRLIGLFIFLAFLNIFLAVGNAYYSLELARTLRLYERKDLSLLPQVDPIHGGYIARSEARYGIHVTKLGA